MNKNKFHTMTFALAIFILTSCNNSNSVKTSDKDLELQKKELALKQKELELKEKQLTMDSVTNANKQKISAVTPEQTKKSTQTNSDVYTGKWKSPKDDCTLNLTIKKIKSNQYSVNDGSGCADQYYSGTLKLDNGKLTGTLKANVGIPANIKYVIVSIDANTITTKKIFNDGMNPTTNDVMKRTNKFSWE